MKTFKKIKNDPLLWLAGVAGFIYLVRMILAFREILFSFSRPILNHDFSMYFARGLRAREFFEASGRVWGYDPFEMGGYLSGPVHEVGSMVLAHPIAWFSSFIPPGVLFNLIILVGGLSLPLLAYWAGAALWEKKTAGLAVFSLVCLTLASADPITPQVWTRGIFGFFLGVFLAMVQIPLVASFCENPDVKKWLRMTVVTSFMVWCHPLSVLVVFFPNMVSFLASLSWEKKFSRIIFGAGLGALVAFLFNAYWIFPYANFSDWQKQVLNFSTRGFSQLAYLISPFVFSPLRLTKNLFWLVAHFFAWKGLMKIKEEKPIMALSAGAAWAAAFVIAFFGSSIPVLAGLQPARNLIFYVNFLLILGSPVFLGALFKTRNPLAGGIILVSVCLFWMAKSPQAYSNQFSSYQEDLIDFVKQHDARDGRILLESNEEDVPILNEILPFMSKGIFIGGGNPGNILKTNFTLLKGSYYIKDLYTENPIFFGGSISSMEKEEIQNWLRRYNIKLVVARNKTLVRQLQSWPEIFEEIKKDEFSGFLVRGFEPGWFLEGGGEIIWDYDKLTILNPEGPTLVLKAHWLKTLTVEGPAVAGPYEIPGVPVPFIQITNIPPGTERIEITNRGLDPFWKKG